MKRITAVERVQRILSILPWIVANPGCDVNEVCERFAIDEKSLRSDLDDVFYNVGLYPFTPDALADVLIEDDRIYVTLGDYFTRPPRLSNSEALTLLTAAKAAAGLTGGSGSADEPSLLTSAIAKLERSLGVDSAGRVAVNIAESNPELMATINDAIIRNRGLRISYYSFGRDQLSERTIDPWAVVTRGGHWYLHAWCRTARGERDFRLDRIYSAAVLEEDYVRRGPGTTQTDGFDGRARTVVIEGPSSVEWVSRSYPVDSVESRPGDRLRIVLPVSAHSWLERLCLRLPVEVTITDLDSGEDLGWIRSAAAGRILDRYGVN